MKKLILLFIVLMLIPVSGWGAIYYGCVDDADIDVDHTFYSDAACTGGNEIDAVVALAGTHTLYANGYTIKIPNTKNLTVTAAKLSNTNGDGATAGGQFTYVTSATDQIVLNIGTGGDATSDIVTGGTTGPVLSITGSAAGAARVTINADIEGGTAASMYGVGDARTGGNVVVNGNLKAGSNASADGYRASGSSGSPTLTINGNATGATGAGVYISSLCATTVSGDCTAGTGGGSAYGCATGSTTAITVSGSIVSSSRTLGANGAIRWTPSSAKKYIKMDGGGTAIFASWALASAAAGTVIEEADTAAKILSSAYFVKSDDYDGTTLTQGTATSGGSAGAWGF